MRARARTRTYRHTPIARDHVGLGIANRTSGGGSATLLRLALLGELPYVISPDKKVLFPVQALRELRSRLDKTAPQAQPMGG
jgi:hypothetical protein